MNDRVDRMAEAARELRRKLPTVCPFPHMRCRVRGAQDPAALIASTHLRWDWQRGRTEDCGVGVLMRGRDDCQCAMLAAAHWVTRLLEGDADDRLAPEVIENMVMLAVGPGRVGTIYAVSPSRPAWVPQQEARLWSRNDRVAGS